ncbi:MAG: TraR/DksA family transcriptional regulator, partial [Xanthomonadales bacterium]|nr:TraR/DksA family transcriptional regulator [Xanthomonadales bacterium]
ADSPRVARYDEAMSDIENQRKKLLALRDQLRAAQETGDEAERPVELDQTRMGRLSRMDALQAQAMSLETGRRRRERLRQVAAALRRIEEGEFGDCLDCGEEIAAARLEVDPTARLCIVCAEKNEGK